MAVFTPSSNNTNQQLIEFQSGLSVAEWYYIFMFSGDADLNDRGVRLAITRNSTGSTSVGARLVGLGVSRSSAFTMDDTTDNVFRDGSLEVNGARTGLSALNATGARNLRQIFANSPSMLGSFAAVSLSKWSNAQVAALHALYKSTLGTGLGLP